ncbi:golvesin C-terminal-like domain-containing protein [Aeoliella mucimassa]|uniref:golvesin C-terminal-like domain-containing protein n=1 Tax=Aeoliella mucimassa TaxID=2527972 RepID=UPI0018D4727D|nr:N-acetylmuramoyl-L-alanine amidase [Aeoliella mucimassa]
MALSALGVTETAYTPTGGLDGKIVYIHGGHGYTDDGSGWGFQRPEEVSIGGGTVIDSEMIEDLGNQDQMTLFANYLFNAGATVVPLRPIGNQPNEAVLDNDDAGVSFIGTWTDSNSSVYYGDAGDVPYRYAYTSEFETSVARYQPDLPESGYYPIYTWVVASTNRATDQLYRIHYSGGEAEVTVDHSRVGSGLVYLGTYYFEAGSSGHVEISNQSSEQGKVVVADMIRFGNGMGDIDRGNGVSGRSREDEAGLYWVEWHVERSQGIPESAYRASSSDRSASVSLAPRYAAYMNNEDVGTLSDRVFVSFHTNAGGGSARGVIGLYNGNNSASSETPNQYQLALSLASEINDDLVSLDGEFEHDWYDRGRSVTLDRSDIEFGEINNNYIDDEFDATIVETGYHDNELDIELLRDPNVRDAIARATYQGLVEYFRTVDGNSTSATVLPAAVDGVWATSDEAGSVTVHWNAAEVSQALGDAATGYRVYASSNGYGFDGGVYVSGGNTLDYTFTGLDPKQTYYFQVVAENEGGASPGSQVVAAKPLAAEERVLIVNGFDRLGRSQNPIQDSPYTDSVQRVRPQESNSGDYLVTVASAIQQSASTLAIDSTSNEAVISGQVDLTDYDAVIWMSGEESSADDTFNQTEQNLVSQYIAGGGNFFASGSEIAWDLDWLNNGRDFFENVLRASYAADNANTYVASGVAGGLLDGLDLSFDDGSEFYDVDYPDVLTTSSGSTLIATYSTGGGAGTYAAGSRGSGDVVVLGFPIESVMSASDRTEAIRRILAAFGLSTVADQQFEESLDNSSANPEFTSSGSWSTVRSSQAVNATFQSAAAEPSNAATWQFDLDAYGQAELLVRWVTTSTSTTQAVYTIDTGFGPQIFYANQSIQSGQWVSLGSFPIAAGLHEVTLTATSTESGKTLSADSVKLVVSGATTSLADFNDNGTVGLGDYTVWRDQLGSIVVRGDVADANGNTIIDIEDYEIWKSQIGMVIAPPASVASPVVSGTQAGDEEQAVVDIAEDSDSQQTPVAPLSANAAPEAPVPSLAVSTNASKSTNSSSQPAAAWASIAGVKSRRLFSASTQAGDSEQDVASTRSAAVRLEVLDAVYSTLATKRDSIELVLESDSGKQIEAEHATVDSPLASPWRIENQLTSAMKRFSM